MAIKKIQIKPPDNNYADILHPETDSDVVLMSDGKTLTTLATGIPIQSPTPPTGIVEGRLWLDTSGDTLQGTELGKIKDSVTGAKFMWKVANGQMYLEEVE